MARSKRGGKMVRPAFRRKFMTAPVLQRFKPRFIQSPWYRRPAR